jgi:hypothetical protein
MGDDFVDADSQVSDQQYKFLFRLNEEGGKVAYDNDLPVPAMLACAAAECGWGASKIFEASGCHFNLQKPAWYTWMKCKTIKRKTDGLGNGTLVWVDFCAADTWAESVGLWCTWILNYPNEKLRKEVLSFRHSPRDFCLRLPKVGFGPQNAAAWAVTAKGYIDVYDQFQLGSFIWVEP